MIVKNNIDAANIGLFILSYVLISPKQLVSLMAFCDPIYCWSGYLNTVKYKHNVSMYSMCMNGRVYGDFKRKNMLYIDGCLSTHENIAGFINSYRCSLFSTNCSFEEYFND